MISRADSTQSTANLRELTVLAEEGQLGRVRDFIVSACEDAGLSARESSNTKLAVDEACTNIIKHAYDSLPGGGDITVSAEIARGSIVIRIRDQGERFDFAGVKDPDLDQYVETGKKGGLGVFLINRLMDVVEYRATDKGNELIMTKRGQAALSAGFLPAQPFRSTLRYKFTMRAGTGLFALMSVLLVFVLLRQTGDIEAQRTSRWLEKRRMADNLAARSVDLLLEPDEFSPEQTSLSTELSKLIEHNDDIAWMRVVTAEGAITSSGIIDEIFTTYEDPAGEILLTDGRHVWKRTSLNGRTLRDISVAVEVTNPATGNPLNLGHVHLGVFEDGIESSIEDNRLMTTVLLFAIFAVGLLLIMGLVRVFVRPIQVLTDGVRAIGDGTTDKRLDIGGPAEIGAIAAVFNDMTDKFRMAQDSVLEQEKMQKEMEVAKEIQQSLLPRNKPEVSGYDIAPLYQAAADVGGDYYDFVQVDDDTIGVVVADVSGKGVPGSLVMTMIRTALRMEARGNKNASDVMSKMNAFVTDDMKKGMFVTMFYVILDSQNRIISYASAGHNPMILYRHETHETYFLNPKGFPVGISLPDEELFRKSISLEKIKLKRDDMLVIYTDGVTEAMNERREQYGEERLLNLIKELGHLSPENFIARLEADIKKFTAGHAQNDDITVVAIKEKMMADDVLYGIRKRLIDLVDLDGMSVREACQQMRVSPSTYYRYKKRLEVLGERGLRNKVLREDEILNRLSLEARKGILEIMVAHPEYGAKRLADEYNAVRPESPHVSDRIVYDELKRLNLNTKELRLEYLRRNRLLREVDDTTLAGKDTTSLVDELLREIPGIGMSEAPEMDERARQTGAPADGERVGVGPVELDLEHDGGVGLTVSRGDDGVAELQVSGHLDSVSSSVLERRLHDLITDGVVRIIVDLSSVSYISSGGWGIFTAEVRPLRQQQGDIVLAGMSADVYDVYELLGFADVLRAFPTSDGARAYFALPIEERMSTPVHPADDMREAAEVEMHRELGYESVVSEWESLRIEATTVGESGEIAVLSLHGIIDTVSAERLRSALTKVIEGGISRLVVDMSQVEYVSSGGWGTFTERLRDLRRAGGDIKLFGMDPDVYYVFTMLGFNIVLSSFDILREAIEDFARSAERPPRSLPEDPEDHAIGRDPASVPVPTPILDPLDTMALAHREAQDVVKWEDMGDGVLIAHLEGPIEASGVDLLSRSVNAAVALQPAAIVFDLTAVTYVSSTGWGQFAQCYEQAQTWGGRVALYGLSPDLNEIYNFLEFRAFLIAYHTREEALVGLARGVGGRTAPAVDLSGGDADRNAGEPAETAAPEPELLGGLDDILSFGPGENDRGATAPGEPQVQGPWPGETFEKETVRDRRADWNAQEETRDESPSPSQDVPEVAPTADSVDMDSAITDKHVDRDRKLREMGWSKYGEKLGRLKDRKKLDGDDD